MFNLFKPYYIKNDDMFYGVVWKYLFSCKAIYVDVALSDGYLGDKEFFKNELSAKFIGQLKNKEEVAEITFCKCRRKDFNKMVSVIEGIHNSALLQGYGEVYEKCCSRLKALFSGKE